jgi:hypothetical protein
MGRGQYCGVAGLVNCTCLMMQVFGGSSPPPATLLNVLFGVCFGSFVHPPQYFEGVTLKINCNDTLFSWFRFYRIFEK